MVETELNTTSMKTRRVPDVTRGYIICLVGIVFWSSTAIFIRYLTTVYNLPALVLAFWRDLFLFGALLLALGVFRRSLYRITRADRGFLLAYAVILAIFNSFWTFSVALNGAAVATVLAYSSAAYTAILGHWLLSEALGWVKMGLVLLSLTGCVLVSGAYDPATWQVNGMGIVVGLTTGLAFAAYSLMGRSAAKRSINPWTAMLYGFGGASVFVLIFNWVASFFSPSLASSNLFWLGSSWAGWLILLLLAIGPTLAGFGLYTVSLGYLPASVANLIATLEPVMTAILAYVFLGEQLNSVQLAGSALIIASVILLRVYEGQGNGKAPA
jgi:drug/metabolite transporter (DMT)-like permease